MIVSLVSLLTTVSSLPSILYNKKKEYYYQRKCLHCVKHVLTKQVQISDKKRKSNAGPDPE